MYIVVGLGNPGREYRNSRHNAGFLTLDILADRLETSLDKRAHKALIAEAWRDGEKIVLAKPQTYMNLSGMSVLDLMNWYKCERERLILVYDDIDLAVGSIRVRAKGSAGTHNGMRSVIFQLGYDDFPRVRIGIGRGQGERELARHVLSRPEENEIPPLLEAMERAADAVELITRGKLTEAQSRFNEKNGGTED